jgi:exodeoxyribonuclease V alpha subunit
VKLGIEKMATIRARAGISYALTEAMDEGHCGLPTDELVPFAEKLLEVPQQLVRTSLELELQEGAVIAEKVGESTARADRSSSMSEFGGRGPSSFIQWWRKQHEEK